MRFQDYDWEFACIVVGRTATANAIGHLLEYACITLPAFDELLIRNRSGLRGHIAVLTFVRA